MIASAGLASTWWEYLVLFLAVAASWAGLPFVGATALERGRGRRQPGATEPDARHRGVDRRR